MFLARSVFWLGGALVIMAPSAGVDMGKSAQAAQSAIVSQGVRVASASLSSDACNSPECVIGRTAIGALFPEPGAETPSAGPQFVPPPRPAWAY